MRTRSPTVTSTCSTAVEDSRARRRCAPSPTMSPIHAWVSSNPRAVREARGTPPLPRSSPERRARRSATFGTKGAGGVGEPHRRLQPREPLCGGCPQHGLELRLLHLRPGPDPLLRNSARSIRCPRAAHRVCPSVERWSRAFRCWPSVAHSRAGPSPRLRLRVAGPRCVKGAKQRFVEQHAAILWRMDRACPASMHRNPPLPSLARKFHRFTAADADMTIFAALNAARVLDVLSSTPARPDSRSPCEPAISTPSLRESVKFPG